MNHCVPNALHLNHPTWQIHRLSWPHLASLLLNKGSLWLMTKDVQFDILHVVSALALLQSECQELTFMGHISKRVHLVLPGCLRLGLSMGKRCTSALRTKMACIAAS